MSKFHDDKIDQLLRGYGSMIRAEADERFSGLRAGMIRRAIESGQQTAGERLRRRLQAFFDEIGLSMQFAGGAAAAALALILAVSYIPSLRSSPAGVPVITAPAGSESVSGDDEFISADLGPGSGAGPADASADETLAMNDLEGAFDQPLGPSADESELWPEKSESGFSGLQAVPADSKVSEDDDIEELNFDEDEFV